MNHRQRDPDRLDGIGVMVPDANTAGAADFAGPLASLTMAAVFRCWRVAFIYAAESTDTSKLKTDAEETDGRRQTQRESVRALRHGSIPKAIRDAGAVNGRD